MAEENKENNNIPASASTVKTGNVSEGDVVPDLSGTEQPVGSKSTPSMTVLKPVPAKSRSSNQINEMMKGEPMLQVVILDSFSSLF